MLLWFILVLAQAGNADVCYPGGAAAAAPPAKLPQMSWDAPVAVPLAAAAETAPHQAQHFLQFAATIVEPPVCEAVNAATSLSVVTTDNV